MAATLIKLIAGNRTREFRPDNVDIIELVDESSIINISMVSGSVIKFETPSPADALAKLGELEAAFTSGTGIVTITDENSAILVTTTTLAPTTSTTTCEPLTITYNITPPTGTVLVDILDFTITGKLFTDAAISDPSSLLLDPSEYVIYSVGSDTFIYGIDFGSRFGNWTINIAGCTYTVNVSSTTTTTLPPTTSTTTI